MGLPVNRPVHQMTPVSRPDLPVGRAGLKGRADPGGRAAHHRALQCRQLRRRENRGGPAAPTAPAGLTGRADLMGRAGQVKGREKKRQRFRGRDRGGESRYREGGEREKESAPAWGTNDCEQIE